MEKKIIWGGLAGGATSFLLGWLFYGFLLMDFFEAQATPGIYKEMPDFPFLIIGNIIMGFLYATVIGTWAKATSAGDGAKKGFVFALLLSSGFNCIMYSTANIMTMQSLFADIAVSTVMGTIVGAVVAMVMGSSQKASS